LLEFFEMKAAEADGASAEARDKAVMCNPPPHATDDELGDNTSRADLAPPSVETMRAMLRHLAARNYFEHRDGVTKDDSGRIDPPRVLSEEPTAVTPHGGICGGES
jgi:hypothetical protein